MMMSQQKGHSPPQPVPPIFPPSSLQPHCSSLEAKLELLETRFTGPASVKNHNHINNNNNNNNNNNDKEEEGESSSLSFGVTGGPPSVLSSHSFGYDAPTSSSLLLHSSSSSPPPAATSTAINKNDEEGKREEGEGGSISRAPPPPSNPTQSGYPFALSEVERVTAQHMAKIKFSSLNLLIQQEADNGKRSLPIPATPPQLPLPPGHDGSESTSNNHHQSHHHMSQATTTTTTTTTAHVHPRKNHHNKRKSTPVKKPQPLVVKSSSSTQENNNHITTAEASTTAKTSTSTTEMRKRPRHPATTTSHHHPRLIESTNTAAVVGNSNSNPPPPPPPHATLSESSGRMATSPSKIEGTVSSTKNNNNNNNNNAKMYDFFDKKKSRPQQRRMGTNTTENREESGSDIAVTMRPTSIHTMSAPSASGSSSFVSVSTTSDPPALVIQELHHQIQHLQALLADKEDQRKAILNNRSLLHAALQSTVAAREAELVQVQTQLRTQQTHYREVVEHFVRAQNMHEAKRLRDTLAINGERLGRIVMNRVGLRTMESWEEGSAYKLLRQRRHELTKDRQKQHVPTPPQQPTHHSHHPEDDSSASTSTIHGHSKLEVAEARAVEIIRDTNRKRMEAQMDEEEKALKLEKTSHIRALKRVASEDASRFRSRPKLHDRYVLQSLLGKGGFSEVWKAYDLKDLREVAVKIHQLDPRWSDMKKESFTKHVSREYEIHRGVRHPRIVSLYDVFEIDINSFATVLECCNGTDLDTLLKERPVLPEPEAKSILLQILVGMLYLSQPCSNGSRQGIIHYDLKPGNILFDEFGNAKITDFGLSKIVEDADSAESMELTSQGAGTYWYLPPECFVTDHKVRISNKVDVWAIGVIFYQMLFGKRPFGDGMTQDKLLVDRTMLNARQVRFPENINVSLECREFIRTCLLYDQADRPSIAELCENEYVVSTPS